MFHALSPGFPGSVCFFQPLSPATPTACLAVSLACNCCRRRDGVTTFHTIDPLGDLGAPSTPMVQQFRAGSYETCNLTTYRTLMGAALYLLILVGKSAVTTLTDIHLVSPYHPSLGLNRGGFSDGFSCHHSNPFRYIVRGASHPVIQRNSSTPA
jgi:hypothetical protein